MGRLRKFKLTNAPVWPHHRGGWTAAVNVIYEQLRADDGTLFVPAVEEVIANDTPLTEPWVGFVHQVPRTTLKWYPDLERLLRRPAWMQSVPHCRGLFTLSSYLRDYLIDERVPVPVSRVLYPVEAPEVEFSLERFSNDGRPRVLFVGEYLRNYAAFFELAAEGYRKILLAPDQFKVVVPASVEVSTHVTDAEYDDLLSRSVVFLNLFDAPANTTVVECIARNTPILINPLPGVVEYLGESYPLYYRDLKEADAKLHDLRALDQGVQYLRTLAIKERLTPEAFVDSIARSAIYLSLPTPKSRQRQFKSYDLTILVCSYKRVYNIRKLLDALASQDFVGTYEIILWNNNWEERDTLDKIIADFDRRIDIRLIHSSLNYYCIMRLAMAELMRSQILLICDDDVIPTSHYISHFIAKFAEYGPDTVLCARGHVFRPHLLNEENPAEFWENYDHMTFYDESVDDRQVHFMHADNCLIPRHILKQAGRLDLPEYEFAVIDDYWLSFVLSHELRIPIWKVRADDILSFTPCAEDQEVALYHSALVKAQRVRFYVHHMRAGWPPGGHADRAEFPTSCGGARDHGADPWENGFGGVNMFSDSPEDDFRAAADYGIKVIRVGAVCGARDLRYLVDEKGEQAAACSDVVDRLTRMIVMAKRYGLKVILSPSHLPGRLFTTRGEPPDLRMWSNATYRRRIVGLWSDLARELGDIKEIIGYDLINEPFTPEDTASDFFEYSESASDVVLNDLYRDIVDAIRRFDRKRLIILEAACWANPLAMSAIHPISDEAIGYSFHMYVPHRYTMRADNGGRYAYPGNIPRWPSRPKAELDLWDRHKIEHVLARAVAWQAVHGISPRRILVGEFGVSRDSAGAASYLSDLTSIFAQNGWNWCLYAFRDDAWDAMDYELSEDRSNMLNRHHNPLFDVVARQFR